MTIWTIGHSTRTLNELAAVLTAHNIEAVVDVRRFPGSRRLPQFHSDALRKGLARHGIAYCWIEALGGRRRPDPSSVNTAWRHPSFRAYADYLGTESFADGFFELLMVAYGLRTAIMCSEVLWWRCHRRLIADVLVTLDIRVEHIVNEKPGEAHRLAPPARLVRGMLSYRS